MRKAKALCITLINSQEAISRYFINVEKVELHGEERGEESELFVRLLHVIFQNYLNLSLQGRIELLPFSSHRFYYTFGASIVIKGNGNCRNCAMIEKNNEMIQISGKFLHSKGI